MNVTTATPAQIDTEIHRIDGERADLQAGIERAEKVLDRIAKVQGTYAANYKWNSPEMAAESEETIRKNTEEIARLLAEVAPMHARYAAERWTRFYLVTNTNGHVHTSTRCRTCFDTTQSAWLTEQSGMSHDDLTDLAGEMSCAECFPNLPPEIMAKKTRIEDPAKRKTRLEREAAKAERDAKKIAAAITPDGSELTVIDAHGHRERFKTERAATTWAVQNIGHHRAWDYSLATEAIKVIIEAIATKHGKTVDEVTAEIEKKVTAWIKRNA